MKKKIIKKFLLCILNITIFTFINYRIIGNITTKSKKINKYNKKNSYIYNNIPTLLIHGSGGTSITYNHMIKKFQKNNYAQKTLTIYISIFGKIKYKGKWDNNNVNPLIQVIFEQNIDYKYEKEAKWIKNILIDLKQKFKINKYNIISHSWGGNATILMMTRYGYDKRLPSLNKAIFLATPVNETYKVNNYNMKKMIKKVDPMYTEMINKKNNISKNSIVYNIYGNTNDNSLTDGEIPIEQAKNIKNIFNDVKQYKEFYLHHVNHYYFHNNNDIINLISNLLWHK